MPGKTYANYIFDLYGTLIDIRTDEGRYELWQKMAEIYACYGAWYTADRLRENYHRFCAEEEEKMRRENGVLYPEIMLDEVFVRLLAEADPAPAKLPAEIPAWTFGIANTFRILSRDRFGVYPGVFDALNRLRSEGRKIFLLSNAQGIFTRTELAVTGLQDCFDDIWISSEIGIRKPQPEFLQSLLRAWDLGPDDTVLIGNDIGSDVRIADLCGIDSVFLNTSGFSRGSVSGQMRASGIQRRDRVRILESGDLNGLFREVQ